MSVLERIGLGRCVSLLFWVLIGIMAFVVALETKHLVEVLLRFRICAVMSIVMVMASISISPKASMVSLESTTVVMTIVFVVASSIMAMSIMRRMHLERRSRIMFVDSQLPLPVFILPHVIIQYNGLV